MDAITALKPDIYPTLSVILVPGFVCAAPWVAGVFWPALQLASTWEQAALPIALTALGVTLVFGYLLEDIGSTVEVLWADKRMMKKLRKFREGANPGATVTVQSNWDEYLGLKTSDEIIGQRYLRSIRLRYKFELSMLPAVVLSAIGLVVSQIVGHGLGVLNTRWVVGICIFIAIYLARETACSAWVLERTRQIVIDANKLP